MAGEDLKDQINIKDLEEAKWADGSVNLMLQPNTKSSNSSINSNSIQESLNYMIGNYQLITIPQT